MIQRLARDFYAPVYKHRQSRGGRARLHKAILYLSELVEIHQTEEYGSNRKIERLFELRNNMERDLVILKEKPKVPNHIDIPFERDELPKIQHHVQDLFRDHATTEKKAKSIGGNIGVNVLLGGGGGVGASCGFTTDILGQKKAVIFGQGHVYNGVIPTINIGYYTHKVSGPFCGGTCSGVTGGLGIGGSYLFELDPLEHPSIEVGIALLGGVKMLGLIGIEICSLSMDWKTQRKNLSLTINTGKFPAWLNGDNIEELMDSYKKNKQKYRIAKKLYSTKPNSDVLSEHVEEVIEAS
jgi:hypothetical protein